MVRRIKNPVRLLVWLCVSYKWLYLANALFVLFLFLVTSFAVLSDPTVLNGNNSSDQLFNLQTFMSGIFVFIEIPFILLFYWPGFLIFHNLSKLLKKYLADKNYYFVEAEEIRQIRKYLIIQAVINLLFFPFDVAGTVGKKGIAGDGGLTKHMSGFIDGTVNWAGEKVSLFYEFYNLIGLTLEGAHPLYYLLILSVAVQLSKSNRSLREELEHVV